MMLDILLTNREAVLGWLDAFAVPLAELRSELDRADEAALARTAHRRPREPHPAEILRDGRPGG